MKIKVKYTESPIGDVKVVRDFLPSPDELAFREEQVKVTTGPRQRRRNQSLMLDSSIEESTRK